MPVGKEAGVQSQVHCARTRALCARLLPPPPRPSPVGPAHSFRWAGLVPAAPVPAAPVGLFPCLQGVSCRVGGPSRSSSPRTKPWWSPLYAVSRAGALGAQRVSPSLQSPSCRHFLFLMPVPHADCPAPSPPGSSLPHLLRLKSLPFPPASTLALPQERTLGLPLHCSFNTALASRLESLCVITLSSGGWSHCTPPKSRMGLRGAVLY